MNRHSCLHNEVLFAEEKATYQKQLAEASSRVLATLNSLESQVEQLRRVAYQDDMKRIADAALDRFREILEKKENNGYEL